METVFCNISAKLSFSPVWLPNRKMKYPKIPCIKRIELNAIILVTIFMVFKYQWELAAEQLQNFILIGYGKKGKIQFCENLVKNCYYL